MGNLRHVLEKELTGIVTNMELGSKMTPKVLGWTQDGRTAGE